MIEDIKKINKNEMFKDEPKKKQSILVKILSILGYGKKGWNLKSIGDNIRFVGKNKYAN